MQQNILLEEKRNEAETHWEAGRAFIGLPDSGALEHVLTRCPSFQIYTHTHTCRQLNSLHIQNTHTHALMKTSSEHPASTGRPAWSCTHNKLIDPPTIRIHPNRVQPTALSSHMSAPHPPIVTVEVTQTQTRAPILLSRGGMLWFAYCWVFMLRRGPEGMKRSRNGRSLSQELLQFELWRCAGSK